MGHIRDKTTLLLIRLVNAIQHAVERQREVPELIVGLRHIQPREKCRAVDLVGGLDHLPDGSEHAAADLLAQQQRDDDSRDVCAQQQKAE